MDFHIVVNQYLRLSPSLYEKYCNIATFKENFHRVYIKVRKDPMETWHPLPYLVTKDEFLTIIQQTSTKWMNPTIDDTKAMRGIVQHAGPSGIGKGKEEEEPKQEIGPKIQKETGKNTPEPLNDVDPIEESPFVIKKRVPIVTMLGEQKK